MPTVTLDKETVFKLIGKKLPDEKLKDRISMLGTDLESVEGNEIHVEIFPNRPDMLSEQGFARALSSFIGVNTGLRKYEAKKPEKDFKVIVEKDVQKYRPFTAVAIVKNLKLNDERIREIIQIQEKLHVTYGRNRKKCALGIYPLEHITLPITYTAKKPKDITFVPLEFDKELNGLQVVEKHPTGKDYGHLLEGLDKFPVFIDAAGEVLSMPPLVNSQKTGRVTESTTEVFVEFSGFNFDVVSKGLNMFVTALADMGGEVYAMDIEYKHTFESKMSTPDFRSSKMQFDQEEINKMLGLELSEKDVEACLAKMGYGYEKGAALVPCYRADVLHPVDLVEDIAIAYGYENFEEIIPDVATVGAEDKLEIFKTKIANVLVGYGLLEAKTYNITKKEDQTVKMGINPEDTHIIELANALNEEYNVLRFWTTPCVMGVLQDNRQHEYPQNVFTIGRIFKLGESETGTVEADRMSVALCDPEVDVTRIRQVLDLIMDALELEYEVVDAEHPSFVPGRVGRVIVNGHKLAYFGEIHPQVLENFGLEMPVAALELNLSELYDVFSALN